MTDRDFIERANRVRRVWSHGKAALNAWLTIPEAYVAEIMAAHDFDLLTVDLQHGLFDVEAAIASIRAIEAAGAAPFVRLGANDGAVIAKLLDAGALGLICPMVDTVEAAERFVRHCSYPPAGDRSYGPHRAALRFGTDYFARADELAVRLAMIENAAGLENVEAIAQVPGLDGLFIGPGDLGISMGLGPGQDRAEPKIWAAFDRILAAAKGAGIKATIHCASPDYARTMIDRGFHMVTVATDAALVGTGARLARQAMD